jgi:tetratricopeptide (TPR) repeat protein
MPRARLRAWLPTWLGQDQRAEQLSSLDLRAYVRESASFELAPAERLRLLAVYLDENGLVRSGRPLADWQVFSRIYAEAERLGPQHSWVFHAKALTAVELAGTCQREDAARSRLLAIATRSIHAALELDPSDADNHYTHGYVLYCTEAVEASEALHAFEAALALDPKHAWAQLYRAHCLQDLERWADAVEAYARVDAAGFVGHGAWRMELLREQRAYCLLRAGDLEGAQAAFEEVLHRRERAIERGEDPIESPALCEPPVLLAGVLLAGLLPVAMLDRLTDTLAATGDQWVLEVARRWAE